MNSQILVVDSSCLIALENIHELAILQNLFGEINITKEVRVEFGFDLPEWIKVREVINQARLEALSLILDKGEASSLALSLETRDCILVIDEKKGRRIAMDLGLRITGTLGIIVKARKTGLIDSLDDFLNKLELAGFWISPNLKDRILENRID